jgi:hypothetical protein
MTDGQTPHPVTCRIELLRYARVSSTSGSVGVANFHGIRDASDAAARPWAPPNFLKYGELMPQREDLEVQGGA